jgi:hypothetical protein
MKTLAEVFVEVLTEEKPRVRVGKGGMRIQLDPKTVAANRTTTRHHGELKPGDHVRQGGAYDRTFVVTHVEPKAEPDRHGNTHNVTIHPVGRIFRSDSPLRGSSSIRGSGEVYKAPSKLTQSHRVSMKKHPEYGWIEGQGPHRDSEASRYSKVAVKPKEAKFTDFYKDK